MTSTLMHVRVDEVAAGAHPADGHRHELLGEEGVARGFLDEWLLASALVFSLVYRLIGLIDGG
jgi:hypothetical protein